MFTKTSKFLGEGNFSEVYEAAALDGSTNYAWKELKFDAKPSDKERFGREIDILSTLDHDHVVSILFAGYSDSSQFFVMPRARRNLDDAVRYNTNGHLDNVRIFKEICQGVIYAHSNGVLHRDLKPQNILLTYEDLVKVSDFGLARKSDIHNLTITRTNDVGGTSLFAAPEQFNHSLKNVDERADVYSLGKILYYMYTRELPYHMDPEHSKLPTSIRYIVEKATQQDREKRFQDVSTLLRRFLSAMNTSAPVGSAEDRLIALVAQRQSPGSLSNHDIALKIAELFLEESKNKVFYLKNLPNVPTKIWHDVGRSNWEMFRSIFNVYDTCVEDPLPFDYTDKVADLYRSLSNHFPERSFALMAISRLSKMGREHDRYYVRDSVIKMMEDVDPQIGIGENLRDFFSENESAARWISERNNGRSALRRLGLVEFG
ncbi:MAG: serine/threonine-protein kinase [Verrucomicrobiota bacterium]